MFQIWRFGLVLLYGGVSCTVLAEPPSLSGIYPHLAMFNEQGECGTGAVVPWAGQLWVVTYAPHEPHGSDDKLYSISPELSQTIHPESIGGTPANRLIHLPSQQLFIGPYAIDARGQVRAVPYSRMFGRPTATALHLFDSANKVVYATMEEGIYELDVNSLEVTELWGDEMNPHSARKANLPGYHGKGFYSGQSLYVYANNGERGAVAKSDPTTPSGVLAEWDGKRDTWTVVRRNQFTEVTGPGGITGNSTPASDPIWAVGWDAKSLLLGVRAAGSGWSFYRLPKGSHSYDGAHGWNTEWPRIRDIGERDFLMTMHGTFWRFPPTFAPGQTAGIVARSNYLKVVGDFCRWNDRLVLGCDDTARNEFLNKRRAKGEIAAPQSQSNLWFVEPERLDQLGPALGRGAVWANEDLVAGSVSDPFLFAGYDIRSLQLAHHGSRNVRVALDIDRDGTGDWQPLDELAIEPSRLHTIEFAAEQTGCWVRLRTMSDAKSLTALFSFRNIDQRAAQATDLFHGLARLGDKIVGGVIRARSGNQRTLSLAAVDYLNNDIGYYELDAELQLRRIDDEQLHKYTKQHSEIPAAVLTVDKGSILFVDDAGHRWRLPKGARALDAHPLGEYRVAREVATERDLFNAHGTFYELPADNAGGFAKVRPVATHNRLIHDYCSFRGLLVLSGVAEGASRENPHIIVSDDSLAALWVGAIDDVWQLGKPRGIGGPWCNTKVAANTPSDAYLMTGYDRKRLEISTTSDQAIGVTAQVDLLGNGTWVNYDHFEVASDSTVRHTFSEGFSAYWIRFVANRDATLTTILTYE